MTGLLLERYLLVLGGLGLHLALVVDVLLQVLSVARTHLLVNPFEKSLKLARLPALIFSTTDPGGIELGRVQL